MEAKKLTLSDLERVTGGELDSITTDYLNEVIYPEFPDHITMNPPVALPRVAA